MNKKFLVVASGHDVPPIIEECDSITGLEVMIVFLTYSSSSCVPLVDFVVVAASDEQVVIFLFE